VVESNFFAVTVEGEVSNFAAPTSGHWYFTLKDGQSQLRAVMFRSRNRLVVTPPADGLTMVCTGTVSVYAARGEVQLIVDSLAPTGVGSLQAAFEALKVRLAAEGLFAEARKRPLPAFPRTVGIVTSMTGAAIHDMLNVLKRRAPGIQVVDSNIGILFFLAMSSLGVYSVALAGWSSGSKYSLLGGLRSSAQMLSYEVFMGLSLMGVVMQTGSFSLREVVAAQEGLWNIIPQFAGFVLFFIAGIAETHRLPFDLPEAESELVAGYHAEYSGIKFGLFFVGSTSALCSYRR